MGKTRPTPLYLVMSDPDLRELRRGFRPTAEQGRRDGRHPVRTRVGHRTNGGGVGPRSARHVAGQQAARSEGSVA
jgi:hypothetical protein